METLSELRWKEGMAFEVQQDGHIFTLDISEKSGGKNLGPRPKALLLSGLAGCTGMDVVSILKKMRVENYQFRLEVDAEMTDEHPKVYSEAEIRYIFTGDNLPEDKLIKAVSMSEEKYCGVSAMLRKAFPIRKKIILNNAEIKENNFKENL